MRHSEQNNNIITPHSDVWRLDYGIIIVYIRKLSADKYRQYLPARGTYGHYLPAILGSSTVRSVRLIYVWRWVVKRLCEPVGCLDCIISSRLNRSVYPAQSCCCCCCCCGAQESLTSHCKGHSSSIASYSRRQWHHGTSGVARKRGYFQWLSQSSLDNARHFAAY